MFKSLPIYSFLKKKINYFFLMVVTYFNLE